jgi:hypothetical protein
LTFISYLTKVSVVSIKNSIIASLIVIGVITSLFFKPKSLISAPPTSVKDTLSSSQLSYFARMSSGSTQVGDSVIKVTTSGNPSNTSNNLFVGDTIGIGTTGAGVGTSGPLTLYTVKDIGNTAVILINSGLGQSNAFINAAIIATRSAIHTITFTPQSNAAGGYWEFLIRASSRTGEVQNDGIPDQQGFDFGATTPSSGANGLGTRLKVTDVTCPNFGLVGGTAAYSVGTTVTLSIGSSATQTSFHVISCWLGTGGTNQVGIGYSMVIGAALASGSQLINPAPALSHTEGNADVYTFLIRHKDGSTALIDADTVQGKIATIESVRVTATVDPTLTFTIDNTAVGTGGTPCGLTAFGANAANTSATSVAFGPLAVAAANDLAQRLSAVTNASNGYVVTVYEDGNLKEINVGTTIPDTTCPAAGTCTSSAQAVWDTYTASGWGYTLQNVNIGTSVFNYAAGYRAFGNGAAGAKTIISNTSTPTATEVAYICYRIVASTTQKEGVYEGKLVYTATATF